MNKKMELLKNEKVNHVFDKMEKPKEKVLSTIENKKIIA